MRTMLRSKVTLLFMTLGLVLAIPAIALADNVQNDVDATTEGKIVSVQAGQKSEDVGYRITATGGDTGDVGSNNCNPASSPVSLTINTPTGVTVEKTDGTALTAPQLTFNSCGTFQFVKFAVASTVTPGDYNVTVADAGASYNENPASFTLRVTTPPDTTAPTGAAISINNAALWTNNASGNVSLALSASDDTGVTSYRLAETEAGLATATPVSVSPAEKTFSRPSVSFTLTGSEAESKAVWLRVCDAQNNCSNASDTIGWDKTNPTISSSADRMDGTTVLGSYVAGTWTNKSVRVSFSCNDTLSGVNTTASDIAGNTLTTEGEDQSVSSTGSCVDQAGNTNSAGASFSNIDIDKTNPLVSLVGGPANGQSYDFGSVPNTPTCDASDALSGLTAAGCVVSGYGTTVGEHTVTASATDNAGNNAEASRTYTVAAAKASGFHQPVDMNDTLNTVKSGSTVPVKFELFGGATNTEQKTLGAVDSVTARKVSCAEFAGDPLDAIEYLAPTSENTGLRFDTTGDQFIYNWKTPAKAANTCYSLTMTAADDTTKLVAYFQLK